MDLNFNENGLTGQEREKALSAFRADFETNHRKYGADLLTFWKDHQGRSTVKPELKPESSAPKTKTPEEIVKEDNASNAIRSFKELPEAVRKSMSLPDYESLFTLSLGGDHEARVAIDHWVASGPGMWGSWGTVLKYHEYLKTKKKG